MRNNNHPRLLRQLRERWPLFVFVLPAFLYILVFEYKPMYGIAIAFQNYKMKLGIAGSEYVGFSNFTRLFASYGVIVVSTLPMMVVYPWLQRFFEKGVMIGSVKG